MKIELNKTNDHDRVSHGVKCRKEGDRIPPLKSNRQSLEQEHHFSFVFCDYSDMCADLLNQLYGWLVPGASSFNCLWKKMWEVDSAPYFTILFSAALLAVEHASLAVWSMWDSAYYYYYVMYCNISECNVLFAVIWMKDYCAHIFIRHLVWRKLSGLNGLCS